MKSLTLFKRNFILLFFAVSIPLIVLGFLSYQRSTSQIETVTSAFLENNLLQNGQRLDSFFHDINRLSESVIGEHKLQFLLEEQLRGKFNEYNFINSIFPIIDDLKGPYQLQIYPVNIDRYPNYLRRINATGVSENTEWYQKSMSLNGSPFWYKQPEGADRIGSSPFLFIRTIRSMDDLKPLAVMVIGVPEQLIDAQLLPIKQYNHFELYIVDRDSDVLYPYDYRGKRAVPAVTGDSEAAPVKLEYVDGRLTAFAPISNTGSWLEATIPKDDLLGPIQDIKIFSWIIIVISLIIISVFLAYLTKKFTLPIRSIVNLMKRLERGDFARSEQFLTRGDEIGQLTRGYNSMVGGMQNLIAATRQAEEEKRDLEMKILINQINPHFLYNTLDSIKWRAEQSEQTAISDMVGSLANLLRFSINDSERFATVEREVEHVKNYLKIELLRNNNSFHVFYQIQPAILNMRIMKLSLQPIVENAVKHAMNKLEHGKGMIMIQVYRQDDFLYCVVEDNGPGSDEELPLKNGQPSESGGVGMFNVNRRLKIQFGDQYGITAGNLDGIGFRVVLKHPVL